MDIRQIECFVAVARKGNYTKAAEELFVSRQALSKTVKHLEKEVGEPLFISVPGQSQLKLTQKGTQLMGGCCFSRKRMGSFLQSACCLRCRGSSREAAACCRGGARRSFILA